MATEDFPLSSNRIDWQTREGFALVSDVTFKVLDDISAMHPTPLGERVSSTPYYDVATADTTDAAKSLSMVTEHMVAGIPSSQEVQEGAYGVTRDEMRHGRTYAYEAGIGELNFAWHFAPALAKAALDEMVDQGAVEPNVADNYKLGDWADMIGSGWFSKTAHRMAYTNNGIYQNFGGSIVDYRKGAFAQMLILNGVVHTPDTPVFDIIEAVESDDGTTYITASPAKPVIKQLRERLAERGRSVGCPVARFSTNVPAEMVQNDPHTRNLLNTHQAEIVPERSDETTVNLHLEWSPIDATLAVIADQLDRYEDLHGTPRLQTIHDDKHGYSSISVVNVPKA